MNLQEWLQAEKKIYTDKDLLRYPAWKIISTIENSGLVIMTDGTIAKNLSRLILTAGDRVLVFQGYILQIDWKKKNIHVPVLFGEAYVICIIGTTTRIHDDRLYYLLSGNTLKATSKPAITDDGKYVPYTNSETYNIDIFHEDPDDYLYRYIGDGINIPSVGNGIAAISSNRIILNEALEDEIWWSVQKNYEVGCFKQYLRHFDTLLSNYYTLQGRPYISRYTEDGVIIMPHQFIGATGSGVLSLLAYIGEGYEDVLLKVPFLRKYKFDETKQTFNFTTKSYTSNTISFDWVAYLGDFIYDSAKQFLVKGFQIGDIITVYNSLYNNRCFIIMDIEADGSRLRVTNVQGLRVTDESAGADITITAITKGFIAGANNNDLNIQRVIEGNLFATSASDYLAEPMKERLYNLEAETIKEVKSYKRCVSDDNACTAFFEGCGSVRDGILCPEAIKNEVILPYDIDSNGKLTYIKVEKDTNMTQVKQSLYCADEFVEGTDWELTPFINEIDYPSDIRLWKTRYKILQSYMDNNFKFILYRKTTYIPDSYTREYLNYMWDYYEPYYMALNTIQTITVYKIYCNGVITELSDYQCENEEKWVTYTYDACATLPAVDYCAQYEPYVNAIGDNITRIFSNAIEDKLLVGFDVFDVNINHTLVYNESAQSLIVEYDDSERPFPPSSDLQTTVQDRKWLLFDVSGNFVELDTPKNENNENVNRINGLGILEV